MIFIGNSIVAGYPWGKGKSFTGVLRRILKDGDGDPAGVPAFAKSTGFDIINKGVNGDTTAGIAARFEAADEIGAVSVYITPTPVDAGKAGYMWLAGCGISYDAVNRDLADFSEMLKSSGRPFVDMNRLYQDYIEELGDPDLAYLDGVHPTPDGHKFMARQVLDVIEKEELYK